MKMRIFCAEIFYWIFDRCFNVSCFMLFRRRVKGRAALESILWPTLHSTAGSVVVS